jgi:hypothetical protein
MKVNWAKIDVAIDYDYRRRLISGLLKQEKIKRRSSDVRRLKIERFFFKKKIELEYKYKLEFSKIESRKRINLEVVKFAFFSQKDYLYISHLLSSNDSSFKNKLEIIKTIFSRDYDAFQRNSIEDDVKWGKEKLSYLIQKNFLFTRFEIKNNLFLLRNRLNKIKHSLVKNQLKTKYNSIAEELEILSDIDFEATPTKKNLLDFILKIQIEKGFLVQGVFKHNKNL